MRKFLLVCLGLVGVCTLTWKINKRPVPATSSFIGDSIPMGLTGSLLLAGAYANSQTAPLSGEFRAGVVAFKGGSDKAANFDVPPPGHEKEYSEVMEPTISNGRLLLRYSVRGWEESSECAIFESNLFGPQRKPVISPEPLQMGGVSDNRAAFTPEGAFVSFFSLPWSNGHPSLTIRRGKEMTFLSRDFWSSGFKIAPNSDIYFAQRDPSLPNNWYPRIWVSNKNQKIRNTHLKGQPYSISPDGQTLLYVAPLDPAKEFDESHPIPEGVFLQHLPKHRPKLLMPYNPRGGVFWTNGSNSNLVEMHSAFSAATGRLEIQVGIFDVRRSQWVQRLTCVRSEEPGEDNFGPSVHAMALANGRYVILQVMSWKSAGRCQTFLAIDLKTERCYDIFTINQEGTSGQTDGVWIDG